MHNRRTRRLRAVRGQSSELGVAQWQPFDPEWLVTLVYEQAPDPEVEAALAMCTRAIKQSDAYYYFIDPAEATGYDYDHNVPLLDDEHGMVVLDIWRDGRVAGVEFPNRL